MAKEIVAWCDVCFADDRREPAAATETIGVGRARPRSVDLCDRHYKELLKPMLDLLDEHGAPTDQAPALAPRGRGPGDQRRSNIDDPRQCGVPDCGQVLRNLKSFEQHVRRAHGLRLSDYRPLYGDPTAPTDPTLAPRAPSSGRPPVTERRSLDCKLCALTSANNHALMEHVRHRHGIGAAEYDALPAAKATSVNQPGIDDPRKCELCGQVSKNRRSFDQHIRARHELKLSQYLERYGEPASPDGTPGTSPVPAAKAGRKGGKAKPVAKRAKCDDCGKVYSLDGKPAGAFKTNRPGQALSIHRAKVHGIPGATKNGNGNGNGKAEAKAEPASPSLAAAAVLPAFTAVLAEADRS